MMEAGRELAGRYVLERPLGGGGMGQVWIARHTTLGRMVAVKLMTPEAHASEVLRARFEREAKACAQLRSPHVVQVFDYGVEGDVPFLVMELLEGEDLAALQESRPLWPLDEVASIVGQAARGLAEAHDAGIVHRDIKLSNLFVARMPGASIVKILDFGIAKAFEQDGRQMTGTDIQLGTPSYMSPEQVLTRHVDHRADLWALAVVAFRLLTGQPAFVGESSILVAQSIVRGERRRVTDLVVGLPPSLEGFFARGLAADPADRFASADELASALTRLAEAHPGAIGRPLAAGAPPPSPMETDTTAVPTERIRATVAEPPTTVRSPPSGPLGEVAVEPTPSVWLPGPSAVTVSRVLETTPTRAAGSRRGVVLLGALATSVACAVTGWLWLSPARDGHVAAGTAETPPDRAPPSATTAPTATAATAVESMGSHEQVATAAPTAAPTGPSPPGGASASASAFAVPSAAPLPSASTTPASPWPGGPARNPRSPKNGASRDVLDTAR